MLVLHVGVLPCAGAAAQIMSPWGPRRARVGCWQFGAIGFEAEQSCVACPAFVPLLFIVAPAFHPVSTQFHQRCQEPSIWRGGALLLILSAIRDLIPRDFHVWPLVVPPMHEIFWGSGSKAPRVLPLSARLTAPSITLRHRADL